MLTSWDEAHVLARALRAIHGEGAPQAAMALAAHQPAQAVAVLAAAAGLLINPEWSGRLAEDESPPNVRRAA